MSPRSLALATAAISLTATLAAAPSALAAEAVHHDYLGKVTARSGLLLRDNPTRSSRVVRTEPYGKVVHIFCKTRGQSVDGNDRWYQLTDGTWAWGSAAYIANLGAAPRWC
ncbi:SH3 domain-containing protein [Streptomyces sp. NPDC001941]|uniref:SH3 domain-containing protein n=1 Tax=Streptomyces sp. NPDC001941 TaxID=3154659 RepID=UPI00332AB6EF